MDPEVLFHYNIFFEGVQKRPGCQCTVNGAVYVENDMLSSHLGLRRYGDCRDDMHLLDICWLCIS